MPTSRHPDILGFLDIPAILDIRLWWTLWWMVGPDTTDSPVCPCSVDFLHRWSPSGYGNRHTGCNNSDKIIVIIYVDVTVKGEGGGRRNPVSYTHKRLVYHIYGHIIKKKLKKYCPIKYYWTRFWSVFRQTWISPASHQITVPGCRSVPSLNTVLWEWPLEMRRNEEKINIRKPWCYCDQACNERGFSYRSFSNFLN